MMRASASPDAVAALLAPVDPLSVDIWRVFPGREMAHHFSAPALALAAALSAFVLEPNGVRIAFPAAS